MYGKQRRSFSIGDFFKRREKRQINRNNNIQHVVTIETEAMNEHREQKLDAMRAMDKVAKDPTI